jgi:hypothetical protein
MDRMKVMVGNKSLKGHPQGIIDPIAYRLLPPMKWDYTPWYCRKQGARLQHALQNFKFAVWTCS